MTELVELPCGERQKGRVGWGSGWDGGAAPGGMGAGGAESSMASLCPCLQPYQTGLLPDLLRQVHLALGHLTSLLLLECLIEGRGG